MQTAAKKQETSNQLMKSARIIGVLMLVQLVFGILLNFYFLKPILTLNAQSIASNLSFLLGFSTILALLLSSFNIAFGVLLQRVINDHTNSIIKLVIIFASVGFTLCALEYAKMTEYVSFVSKLIHQPTESIIEGQELIRKTLASGRNEVHFLSIMMSSLSVLLFYVAVLRNNLMPQLLSLFAIFACTLQLIAVGHTLFELSIPMAMQLPLFIAQIVVPVYLIVKGFKNESLMALSITHPTDK